MSRPALLTLVFLFGVVALAGFRFALVPLPESIHFHANWAIFIDGERLDLTDDRFMEDVAACAGDPALVRPTERVHLHDNNHDVVHVHHGGATWGHLMANLRMVLGDRVLVTRDGELYRHGEGGTLKFVLNGRPEISVVNETIRGGDRLLISFGPESVEEVIATQFPQVLADAPQFDGMDDPAGCGGVHHPTVWSRLRHAFTG